MRLLSDVERRLDGYCVMIATPRAIDESLIFVTAPLGSNDEYVFRTFEDALEYGNEVAGDVIVWKIVPFFVSEENQSEDFANLRFSR